MLADMLTTGLAGNELRRVARGGLASALDAYDPRDVVREQLVHAPPREVGLVNSMRYLDLKLTLAGGILVKVDRASMAVALEVRPVTCTATCSRSPLGSRPASSPTAATRRPS